MNQPAVPRKYDALIAVRKSLAKCPICGKTPTEINANSHKTSSEETSVRFYFQFLHDDEECIAQVMAVDFATWLKARISEGEKA